MTNAIDQAGCGIKANKPPVRFAAGGRGEQIAFTAEKTAFGWMAVGATERGLCWLALGGTKAEAEASLRTEFPLATLKRDSSLAGMVDAALAVVSGPGIPVVLALNLSGPGLKASVSGSFFRSLKAPAPSESPIYPAVISGPANSSKRSAPPQVVLDLRGTEFQLRVWQALRQIPRGETRSYSQLARELGSPNATRAVARACAMNRVALVVPCHRVVGATGALTGYRWGIERKRKLLEKEREPAR
jgi:AraC family transcriptional regulator of adaptative response/methylated-DNA-[protein]-cysteine methyltransferase